MACFYPLDAWQLESGQVVFAERGKIRRHLKLPCGQCVGCRLERSRQWAVRCVHEASLHKANAFVTLTYDDEHLPAHGSLVYRDYQLFMKRLRKRIGKPVRFFMCGEYGDKLSRPHFHACLFGAEFPNMYEWATTGSGSKIYRSALLESIWPYGFASIGDVTFESAAYVARYVMKKVTGNAASVHYQRGFDVSTGEVLIAEPEFCHMSLKPGIGANWIERFKGDVYPEDRCIINGVKVKPPRYYDKWLAAMHGFESDEVDYDRYLKSLSCSADSSPARLAVREEVTLARLNFKPRSLE